MPLNKPHSGADGSEVSRMEDLLHDRDRRKVVLTRMGFSCVPSEELNQLHALEVLVLSNNNIRDINEEFGRSGSLRRLKSIELSFNRLSSLPSSWATTFSHLTELEISYNYFRSFPDVVYKLSNLEGLGTIGNKIDYLPLGVFRSCPKLELFSHDFYPISDPSCLLLCKGTSEFLIPDFLSCKKICRFATEDISKFREILKNTNTDTDEEFELGFEEWVQINGHESVRSGEMTIPLINFSAKMKLHGLFINLLNLTTDELDNKRLIEACLHSSIDSKNSEMMHLVDKAIQSQNLQKVYGTWNSLLFYSFIRS